MQHLPAMIHDLALILATAAFVTLLFKRLNQPLVLGYLMAGFLVGPHSSVLPTVIDTQNVTLWSEMGVIFLLFALGLEFSFKKLMRVGGTAGITAVFEIGLMLTFGFLTGKALGWNTMDSIFLGGIISISSTSVILRTIEELGLKNKKFVSVVFGVLVIEDLVAVVLMVLLSTVSLTKQFAGMEMLASVAKLGFFLMVWFIFGVFLLPSFLKKVQSLLTEETILVIAIGLCLMMVIFANQVGFSSALGAFVTGSLLAETIEAERIHHLVKPVKDLFSAVFFVSVGMLINPTAISDHWQNILIIGLVVIIGKTLSVSLGALITGQGLKPSIQTGMTLSQIGEFSFIIATLGLGFKVISENLYPIAVAVSVLTTFTTPYMVRSSGAVYKFFERVLPATWVKHLDGHKQAASALSVNQEWRELVRSYVTKIILNAVVAVAVFLFASRWMLTWLLEKQMEEGTAKLITLSLTLILSSPFLWAVAFGRTEKIESLKVSATKDVKSSNYVFLFTRVMLTVVLLGVMVAQFVTWYWALVITLWMGGVISFVMYKYLEKTYHWFEKRFLINFHNEEHEKSHTKQMPALAPWDGHITEYTVPAEAHYVGKPLEELSIREKFGVTIALIERGRRRIQAPGRQEKLMPFDRLAVIGTDEQLDRFEKFIGSLHDDHLVAVDQKVYSLERLLLAEKSQFLNKTIRDSGLRELTHGLVVGIERAGKRILNPDSAELLLAGDVLWIVGDKELITKIDS